MQYTTNYSLKKPDGTDNYNVANDNANMDAIDVQMKANANAAAAAQSTANAAIPTSEIGQPNGVCDLDANGDVPASRLGNVSQPANATATTPGLIQLAGDITGTATSPALTTTGVTPGTYVKVTVDPKGRITATGVLSASDVTTALGYTPLSTTGEAASAAELTDYNGGHSIKATWNGSAIEFEVDSTANEPVAQAENATNAGYATNAGTAANANALGGQSPAYYAPATTIGSQIFTASGTFAVPAGVSRVFVQAWGGGGGGGWGNGVVAGGGGGGGYAEGWVEVSNGQQISVTVGTGGAGTSGSNFIGSPGGTSSFGSYVQATGGAGGSGVNGGQTGGTGGNGTYGTLLQAGSMGDSGSPYNGGNAATTFGGAGGAGSSTGDGSAGYAPGGGGGGSYGTVGGAGARGEVRVYY